MGGVPQAPDEAEGVEERKHGAHVVRRGGREQHAQRLDFGEDVVVAQHDALRLARGAGGKAC